MGRFIDPIPALGDDHAPIDEPLVTVATYNDPSLAHVDRVILEQQDFTPVVTDGNIVAMDWLYSNAVGGVKLQVPSSQLAAARDVLATPLEFEEEADVAPPHRLCPQCGSDQVYRVKAWRKSMFGLMLGIMLVIGLWFILFPIFGRRLECDACGHQWKP